MAENGKVLKGQNWKYILVPYLGANLIALVVVATGVEDIWNLSKAFLNSAVVSIILGIAALVFNGLLSADNKARLVFWRVRHPLPGCRAFSEHMRKDPRVDPEALETQFGPLPDAPDDQNRLWYRVYKGHSEEPSIIDAHRSYLATRDLATLRVLFLLTFVPAGFFLAENRTLWVFYAGSIAVLYLLTSQAARTYGQRLVKSVLASASGQSRGPLR